MPTTLKITKEKIIDVAFEIARKKGLEGVSNREIAKKLNSSIRPIYYQFENAKQLKNELYKRIEEYFYSFLLSDNNSISSYKQVGINYIKFAKKEKKLFKILFMSDVKLELNDVISNDNENFIEIAKLIKPITKLSDEQVMNFHTKMWIFTHGIATLVASDTITLNKMQIGKLLTSEFKALMFLEKNK